MKIKEYIRLARINIKEHKYQTTNTIRGLSFSMILLIPIVFILLAFYFGTMNLVNDINVISSFHINYEKNKASESNSYLNYDYIDDISKLNGIENCTTLKKISMPINYSKKYGAFQYQSIKLIPILTIDNENYSLNHLKEKENRLEFYDLNKSNNIVSKSEKDYLKKTFNEEVIIQGTSDISEEKDIIISRKVLDELDISYEDVLGKTVSYQICLPNGNNAYYSKEQIGSDYLEKYVYVFKNYKIVGVFNDKLYSSPSRIEYKEEVPPLFWMNISTIFNDGLLKYIYENEDYDLNNNYSYKYYYQDSIENIVNELTNNGKVFIPFGFNCYGINSVEQIIQFNNFESAQKNLNKVIEFYKESYDYTSGVLFSTTLSTLANDAFVEVYEMYPLILGFSLVLFVFAIIILLSAIINLYNTFVYSVMKRKRFLNMMCAIGMTKSEVKKLYFFEMLMLLVRALFWTLLFSLIMSVGIMYILNSNLRRYDNLLPISISINFLYYPIAYLIISTILVVISLILINILFFNKNKINMLNL